MRVPTPARFLWLVFVVVAHAAFGRSEETLMHARQAQARLGPDIWSQVIEVENHARRSAYPPRFHALVFELAGRLWFYTSVNGTQSFSLYAGRLQEEKADFGPLLRDIEPGFTRWRPVLELGGRATRLQGTRLRGELPNGCVIDSVAELRARLRRGEPITEPRLLFFYVDLPDGERRGHTVLVFEREGRLEVVDSTRPGATVTLTLSVRADPLALARQYDGKHVDFARELALREFVSELGPDLVADAARPRAPADARDAVAATGWSPPPPDPSRG